MHVSPHRVETDLRPDILRIVGELSRCT